MHFEIAIEEILDPAAEPGSNEVFHIVLDKCVGEFIFLIGNLGSGKKKLDEVVSWGQWLRVFTQALLPIKKWINGNQFGSALHFHEFILNDSHFLFYRPYFLRLTIFAKEEILIQQIELDRIEVVLELLKINRVHIEFILEIF